MKPRIELSLPNNQTIFKQSTNENLYALAPMSRIPNIRLFCK